jgi:hypothetical protein
VAEIPAVAGVFSVVAIPAEEIPAVALAASAAMAAVLAAAAPVEAGSSFES